MKATPMAMLCTMLAGWINWHQQDALTDLKEGNKILREKLGTGTRKIHASLIQHLTPS